MIIDSVITLRLQSSESVTTHFRKTSNSSSINLRIYPTKPHLLKKSLTSLSTSVMGPGSMILKLLSGCKERRTSHSSKVIFNCIGKTIMMISFKNLWNNIAKTANSMI